MRFSGPRRAAGPAAGPTTPVAGDPCAARRDAVDAKTSELHALQQRQAQLQAQLHTATPQQKSSIIARIVEVGDRIVHAQEELADLEAALAACLASPHPPLGEILPEVPHPTIPTPYSPPFPSPPTVSRIYARAGGSDTQGDGKSETTAYRTFQRAIRDVPLIVHAGYRYIVDVSGLGTETFPKDYGIPPIHGACPLDQLVPDEWFRFRGSVSVYAEPRLLSWPTVPVADIEIEASDIASLEADPVDGLHRLTLTAPRASWAGDALRGIILRAHNHPEGDAVVVESTETSLLLSTSIRPDAPMWLMEQSATFEGTGIAFGLFNVQSFAFGGIRFENTDGPSKVCLGIRSPTSAFAFQYCDIRSRLAIQGTSAYLPVFETCSFQRPAPPGAVAPLPSTLQLHGVSTSFRKCLFDRISSWDTIPDVGYIYMEQSVFQNGKRALGDVRPFSGFRPTPDSHAGGGLGLWLRNCRVRNGESGGIRALAGGTIESTRIEGCGGDAIHAEASRAMLRCTQVGGDDNDGVGLRVTQNSAVNVDPATTVTGAEGDLRVGNNAVRSWLAFRTLAPILEENDLAAGSLSQMCRLYQT